MAGTARYWDEIDRQRDAGNVTAMVRTWIGNDVAGTEVVDAELRRLLEAPA